MNIRMKVATCAALAFASAGMANAQQIDPQCMAQAASAGITATHDVVYNATDNTCVATRTTQATVSSQGQVIGALSPTAVVGGTLVLVTTIAVVGDLGSSGGTN